MDVPLKILHGNHGGNPKSQKEVSILSLETLHFFGSPQPPLLSS